NRTLDFMVDGGYLTEAERAEQVFPEVVEPQQNNRLGGPNGYLLEMVRSELLDRGELSQDMIDGGGLDIITTIDPTLQDLMVETAQSLPDDAPENLKVAMVSMDPRTGAVVALYGGPDFVEEPRNRVTPDVAQGGSTVKPFTLVAALEDGSPREQRYPASNSTAYGTWWRSRAAVGRRTSRRAGRPSSRSRSSRRWRTGSRSSSATRPTRRWSSTATRCATSTPTTAATSTWSPPRWTR